MAAMDFPVATVDGQLWTAPTGMVYKWVAAVPRWVAVDARTGSSPVPYPPTAPTSPAPGALWFNPTDGNTYIWYDDGTSQQWVSAWATGTATQASLSAEDNLLYNGGFDFWQRAAGGFAGIVAPTKIADRWWVLPGTGVTISAAPAVQVPGAVAGGDFLISVISLNRTVAGSSVTALEQRVESVRTASGQTLTASFLVNAPAAGTHTAQITQYFGTGGSPSSAVFTPVSYTVNTASTWERKIVTIAVPSISGKTLGSNGDDSLGFGLLAASTLGTGTWYYANVDLRIGAVAPAKFLRRPIQQELALCQRYYQIHQGLISGQQTSGIGVSNTFALPVRMRASPTFVYSNKSLVGTAFDIADPTGGISPNGITDFSAFKTPVASASGNFNYTVALDAEL